jgi:peroxiredoxin Q/BCP
MKWLVIVVVAIVALLLWRMSAFANRNLPKAGDTAPDFTLPDQNGRTHGLVEFRGGWVVLYFFPKADTPG